MEKETIPFSQAISWEPREEGQFFGEITEDWTQGRTAFGGLVAASALRCMEQLLPSERALRSLQVSFLGPLAQGEAQAQVQILRQGRALTYIEARITQADAVRTLLLGSFGASRETKVEMEMPPSPELPPADEFPEMPFVEDVTPNFTQHIAYRWTNECYPFSGSSYAVPQGWCRIRDEQPIGTPGLVALLDAWAPPVLSVLKEPCPASTVTWMMTFLEHPTLEQTDPDAWWLFQSATNAASHGYADASGQLWDHNGRLIARSRQMIAEFSGQ